MYGSSRCPKSEVTQPRAGQTDGRRGEQRLLVLEVGLQLLEALLLPAWPRRQLVQLARRALRGVSLADPGRVNWVSALGAGVTPGSPAVGPMRQVALRIREQGHRAQLLVEALDPVQRGADVLDPLADATSAGSAA